MAKKEFKTTSEMFLSTPAADQSATPVKEQGQLAAEIPAGYKLVRESTPERAQFLLRPTTAAALKKAADERGISKNELVNQIIDEFLQGANE